MTTVKYRKTGWKKAKIDYLLYSKPIKLVNSESLTNEIMKIDYGCPNEICPSDHLYIISEFLL